MNSLPRSFFSGSSPVVLVAGGAGFVGSRFCAELLKRHCRVLCVDNLLTGHLRNIEGFLHNEHFHFFQQDIADGFSKSIERVDYVIHLGALEAYQGGEDVTLQTLEANSQGTRVLLDYASEMGARVLLGSSVDIYEVDSKTTSLQSALSESDKREGLRAYIEAKRFAEALASEYLEKKNLDVRVVRVGDVYGPEMSLGTGSVIARLFRAYVKGQPLEVSRDDGWVHPVFINDLVWGLSKALFSAGTKGSIISLAGDPVNITTFVDTVRSVRPGTAVSYVTQALGREELQPAQLRAGRELISWEPHTTILEGIALTLDWLDTNREQVFNEGEASRDDEKEEKVIVEEVVVKPEKVIEKEQFWREPEKIVKKFPEVRGEKEEVNIGRPGKGVASVLVGLVLLWLVLSPWFAYWMGLVNMRVAFSKYQAGDYESVDRWISFSQYWFRSANESLSSFQPVPYIGEKAQGYARNSIAYLKVLSVGERLVKVNLAGERIFTKVLGEERYVAEQDMREMVLDLETLEKDVAFIESEFSVTGESFPFAELQDSDFRRSLRTSIEFLKEGVGILGGQEKRTYLILIADNTELRPTGGYISTYGLVSFEGGRVVSAEFQEVSLADSQLKGKVEPPLPIKEYLGEEGWYLRDVAWSSDFRATANRAEWFIDKELGRGADGVLLVDLEFIKSFLESSGELVLGDDKVRSEDVYRRLQEDQGQGSNAFLLSLVRKLYENTIADPKDYYGAFVSAWNESAIERHLAFYGRDLQLQKVSQKNGWDGAIRSEGCDGEGCVADYIYQTDANLSINKVNYFIDKTQTLDINLKDNILEHKLTVSYKNKSGPNWPGGEYKNYFTLFLPDTVESVRGLSMFEGEQEEVEIVSGEDAGKQAVSTYFSVMPGEERQLVFTWSLPVEEAVNSYSLVWQKQLGAKEDPVWLTFNNSKPVRFTTQPPASLTTQNTVSYNTKLSRDLEFKIQWP